MWDEQSFIHSFFLSFFFHMCHNGYYDYNYIYIYTKIFGNCVCVYFIILKF